MNEVTNTHLCLSALEGMLDTYIIGFCRRYTREEGKRASGNDLIHRGGLVVEGDAFAAFALSCPRSRTGSSYSRLVVLDLNKV